MSEKYKVVIIVASARLDLCFDLCLDSRSVNPWIVWFDCRLVGDK